MKLGSPAAAIWILALLSASPVLGQQAWPSKPIRFIVPYSAGGFADIRARKIGAELAKAICQPLSRELFASTGSEVGGGTPEAFGALTRSETEIRAKVVKQAGIRPE